MAACIEYLTSRNCERRSLGPTCWATPVLIHDHPQQLLFFRHFAKNAAVLLCTGKKIVKALYDYTGVPADNEDEIPDLDFTKDELMEVTKE